MALNALFFEYLPFLAFKGLILYMYLVHVLCCFSCDELREFLVALCTCGYVACHCFVILFKVFFLLLYCNNTGSVIIVAIIKFY